MSVTENDVSATSVNTVKLLFLILLLLFYRLLYFANRSGLDSRHLTSNPGTKAWNVRRTLSP